MYDPDSEYEHINNNGGNIGNAPGDQRTGFLNLSLKICKVFGIEIRVHVLLPFFFLFTLFIWIPMITGDSGNWPWYLLLILLFNISLWESVLLHELGHCLAGYLIGGHTDKVLLWPLGGLAFTQPPATLNNAAGDAKKRKNHIMIAFGGPLTHIPHMLIYGLLIVFYCSDSANCPKTVNPFSLWEFWQQIIYTKGGTNGLWFWYDFIMLSFMINFWLFIVNLLIPAYPLDGSRIFINLLLNKYNRNKSAIIYCWVTGFISALSIIIGATLFRSNTMLFFIGIWAAFQVYQMVMYIRAGQEHNHPLLKQ